MKYRVNVGLVVPPFKFNFSNACIYCFAAVRYGRVPKRSRERSDSESNRVSTSDSSEHSDAGAVYDVILMVSQAHHSNCDYTEEQTRGLIRRPIASPVSAHKHAAKN